MGMRSIKVDKNTKWIDNYGFSIYLEINSSIQKEENMQWWTRENVYVREGLKPKDRELKPHITLETRGQEDKEKKRKECI